MARANELRQILGHQPRRDNVETRLLEARGEGRQGRVVVELCPVRKAPAPGEDRGDWIR
jgi:hypothetical protein